MRLDLKAFQRQKRSGLILIGLVLLAGVIVFGLVAYMNSVSKVYLEVEGNSIPSAAAFDKLIGSSKKPVAVMFESPTCPVCKKMYPYWARLEEMSNSLPVSFYHIMYSAQTDPVFRRYSVFDTPTFIVFVDGKVAARHIGAFVADNVTSAMLSWVIGAAGLKQLTPENLAKEGLNVFNNKCSACHGVIPGLDAASLRQWLQNRKTMNDFLANTILEAISQNKTLEEYYGDYSGLQNAILSMRKYVDISAYELDRTSYLLSYISHVLLSRTPPSLNLSKAAQLISANTTSVEGEATPITSKPSRQSVTATSIVGAIAAFVAGFVAAFSPCVLPLLVTQAATMSVSGRRLSAATCGACGLASFAGVIAIGLLFVVAGALAAGVQQVLLPVIALAIIAAGAASMFGVPVELDAMFSLRRGGVIGFCAAYGFLAVQCSLPLVVGSLLLVAGSGAGLSGVLVATSFALGVSIPLAIILYAVSRLGAGIVNRIMERKKVLDLLGGGVLLASGVYLLLYSLGFV
jgi:cytochrome c biogenesis protein CcdA/thiol-disulfide isomerase/thioredoxin